MIRICALNEESEGSSSGSGAGSDSPGLTREALEQVALGQYARALELQRQGAGEGAQDALRLLRDLLETELLYDIKKPGPGEKVTEPLFNLKYLCYKNIASIHASLEQKEEAIEAYCDAASLDDTDVTLWHRLGTLCFQCDKFEMSLHAFQKGYECNSKHWPCIDKIITLLLGLGHYNDCISAIYDAFNLDPDYLRGLVYSKYIYTNYPYILEFMTHLNPMYAWKVNAEEQLNEKRSELLLKEAEVISEKFRKQTLDNTFAYTLPHLKLKKPLSYLSWLSLGESLVHMHHYMTKHCYSHASILELVYDKDNTVEIMDVDQQKSDDPQKTDSCEIKSIENGENEKNDNCASETENNDLSDKNATDNEKVESDLDNQQIIENKIEGKDQKKVPIRRRGSALSFLEQWEWCTRRSTRKKPTTKQDRANETIYDTLRRLVPISLTPDLHKKKENSDRLDDSPDTMDLYRLFEEKSDKDNLPKKLEEGEYFGSALEETDVNSFITKYNDNQCDVITILREYLITLANKWSIKWPDKLPKVFVEANKCCSTHFDIPCFSEDNFDDLRYFTLVNLMSEEMAINEQLNADTEEKETYDMHIVEIMGLFVNKPQVFGGECLPISLRHLWLKCHCYLYNKNEEFALDCLYQLLCEFEALGEHEDSYILNNVNFTSRSIISKSEVASVIKCLERNKRLSTVMGLYDLGNFEEAVSIIVDSFEHCKSIARKQEYDEMSLDFAVQLSLILDCYWSLGKAEQCFKWSVTCLHESLKHYMLCSPSSQEYEKWGLVVIKVLICMAHCLKTEGCSYLDVLTEKELSQAIQDVIQVIGHQVDVENNAAEMPLNTVTPWIIIYYILQREEDQGRCLKMIEQEKDKMHSDEVPSALMVLFVGHDYLGRKGWCCNYDGQLLYFMLDTVIPRLRTPALSRCVELICQYLEQCVFCLYGHPSKKTKLRYLVDHNVTPHKLDWERSEQLYELFKPLDLPEIEGKVSCISAETENLLQRMFSLLPKECEPQKYVPDILNYIEGKTETLPVVSVLLPYKMKDIFFLLGDYYFKKDERAKSMKYNYFDVIMNNDRFESWAEIALAKAANLEAKLNSSVQIQNDMDYISDAAAAIRCFKRALELDSMHCNLWIEYGVFSYSLHSFCSRLLKQASESLSMEDFESLEQKKEDMLDTAQKCFTTVSQDLNSSDPQDDENDELWLHYYMLGKIAEKRNKHPREYLNHYMQAAKHLQENKATYPSKINYNSPQHLSIEALEMHYRIHASILKYMEQHENKVIMASDGKIFQNCLEHCGNGPFSTKKKSKKDVIDINDTTTTKPGELVQTVQASSILKRSISDAGEESSLEVKKSKLENAAKVRRAASYDADCQALKDSLDPKDNALDVLSKAAMIRSQELTSTVGVSNEHDIEMVKGNETTPKGGLMDVKITETDNTKKNIQENILHPNKEIEAKKDETTSNSSSSSTSDTSSDDSSSDSSTSSADTDTTTKSSNESKPMSESEINQVISVCLDALEDCVSRFSQHYKALYRLAHYHFYYKKGKDIERCRDLMLANFTSRNNQKLQGLFSERKNNNFFNAIWRIPAQEVDRAGSFACHMSRCVLLSMEILKEIDDHKTLLDLNMQLARIPEPDKKYLRDSERDELAQQAFSLCIQSLKGQLTKFSQQADIKTNDMEKKTLNSLMLDIYRAYQKAQKQPNSKQFTNLLVEGFKLVSVHPLNENANLVDLSMRHCQTLIATLKQQATMASLSQSTTGAVKKNTTKSFDIVKTTPIIGAALASSKPDAKSAPTLPLMSPQEITAAFQNYLPMLNDSLLSQQTAAALSLTYMTNLSTIAGYTSLQNSLQNTLQTSIHNTFQSEFYRQFLASKLNSSTFALNQPKNKQGNRGKKNYKKPTGISTNSAMKVQKPKNTAKSFNITGMPTTSVIKPVTSIQGVVTSLSTIPKAISTPSLSSFGMNQILAPTTSIVSSMSSTFSPSVKPAHMSSTSLTTFTSTSSGIVKPAHMTTTSTVNAALHTKPPLPHQQVSPGKTLQEKLAERQKNLPAVSKSSAVMAQELNSSINKLPASLTVTKTSINKPATNGQNKDRSKETIKKPEGKRLQFEKEQLAVPKKPMSSSEIIVLDDDDD